MPDVPLANWNGSEMPLDQVRVSVLDRAFLFGDAIYEVFRVYQGRLWLLEEHWERLRHSLDAVRIVTDLPRLRQRMLVTLAHSGVDDGIVYLQITRGEAPRTHYFPKKPTTPNELIYAAQTGDPYAPLRATGAKAITRPDLRWKRCDIKSVNLLANCLACQDAVEGGAIEALLISADGAIAEATHSSAFVVRGGAVWTTPNGPDILPGITRAFVIGLARRLEIPVIERSVTMAELDTIDELFLTGTGAEVLPIVRVDDTTVGRGAPGPITLRLANAYRDAVRAWLAEPARPMADAVVGS